MTTLATLARVIGRSVLRSLGAMYAATLLVFVAMELSIPGGYRTVVFPNGYNPDNARQREVFDSFHLGSNVVVRHLHWIGDVARGEFGQTNRRGGATVVDLLADKVVISVELAVLAMVIAVVFGIGLGLLSAASDGSARTGAMSTFFGVSQSLPVFMTGTFLIWGFAVKTGWFPAAGWVRPSVSLSGHLRVIVLPVLSLALAEIGIIALVVRRSVRELLDADFVAFAMSKGMSRRYVLSRHVLRPASLTLSNVIGLNVSALLGGAFLVEIVFAIGGLGQELVSASVQRDLFLLLALVLYNVGLYRLIMSAVDMIVFWADPRIGREPAG